MSLQAVAIDAVRAGADRVVPGGSPPVERTLRVERLRAEITRRQADWKREEREARCPTGLVEMDRLLGGGFPKGLVTALGGPCGAGASTAVARAMAQATAAGECCAWVDGTGSLSAPALAALGVDLSRLLLVKAPAQEAAWAAQLIARSGAFSLVAADVTAEGWSVGALHRLGDAVRAGQCALVLVSRDAPVAAALKARLEAAVSRPSFLTPVGPSAEGRGTTPAPRRQVRMWVERSRRGGEVAAPVRLDGERHAPPDSWGPDGAALGLLARRQPGPAAGELPLLALARRLHTRPRSRWRSPSAEAP